MIRMPRCVELCRFAVVRTEDRTGDQKIKGRQCWFPRCTIPYNRPDLEYFEFRPWRAQIPGMPQQAVQA
jgi:hypothetical protein